MKNALNLGQERKEELRVLSQRLCAKGQETDASFEGAIERYRHLAEQIDHEPALNDALVERTLILFRQGRYCEALQILEERLAKNPQDLAAQGNWRRLLNEVHGAMVKLADSAPETAEYGRTYERLVQVGYAGNPLHLGAIRHYLASGRIEDAVRILLPLGQMAPGAPGVTDAILRAARVSDDVRIQKLRLMIKMEDQ